VTVRVRVGVRVKAQVHSEQAHSPVHAGTAQLSCPASRARGLPTAMLALPTAKAPRMSVTRNSKESAPLKSGAGV
jgi:hypothetical protein